MSDRTLGFFGVRVPADRLTNVCKRVLAAQFGCPLEDVDNVKAEDTLLLSRVGEYGITEYSTLITEGVRGERAIGTNTIEVYTLQGYQSVVVHVGIPLIVELSKGGDLVDLADHVRVFGGRLESNLYRAQRWMAEFVDPTKQ